MAAIVNENMTGSFSIQTISGSTFFIFNTSPNAIAKIKQNGGSIGGGSNLAFVQLDFETLISSSFFAVYADAYAAGPDGYFSYGVKP